MARLLLAATAFDSCSRRFLPAFPTAACFPSSPPRRRLAMATTTSPPLLHTTSKASPVVGGRATSQDAPQGILEFVEVAHKLADAAGAVVVQYFRKGLDILDKEDLSPVTIADRSAELAMRKILSNEFPSHAIFGEEWGLTWPKVETEYIWVLDPIDGTKSFITGNPIFGTLIALIHKGTPILGIIDQPVLKERWVGMKGAKTLLNGQEITTRVCSSIQSAYLYTTSPHYFTGEATLPFQRVQTKVKASLYGCDCYGYGLLAAGHVDLVIESGLKPYDFLALVPVVEGAGGIMTDWKGHILKWWPTSEGIVEGFEVIAAGNEQIHQAALAALARD